MYLCTLTPICPVLDISYEVSVWQEKSLGACCWESSTYAEVKGKSKITTGKYVQLDGSSIPVHTGSIITFSLSSLPMQKQWTPLHASMNCCNTLLGEIQQSCGKQGKQLSGDFQYSLNCAVLCMFMKTSVSCISVMICLIRRCCIPYLFYRSVFLIVSTVSLQILNLVSWKQMPHL